MRIECISYELHRTICDAEGNPEDWLQIGPSFDTLNEAHAAAKRLTGHFSLVEWNTRKDSAGGHGGSIYSGWSDRLPPVEELRDKAQRARDYFHRGLAAARPSQQPQ